MLTLFEISLDTDLDGSDVMPLLKKTGKAIGGWLKDKADDSEIGLKKIGHSAGKVAHSAWKAVDRTAEDVGDSAKIAYQKSKRYLGDKYEDKFDKPAGVFSAAKRSITRSWRDTFDDPEDNIKGARKSLRSIEDKDYANSIAKRAKEIATDESNLTKSISDRAKRKARQLADIEAGQKLLKQQKEGVLNKVSNSDNNSNTPSIRKTISKVFSKNDNVDSSNKPSFFDRAKEFVKKNTEEKSEPTSPIKKSSSKSFFDRAKEYTEKQFDQSDNNKEKSTEWANKIKKAAKKQAEQAELGRKNPNEAFGKLGSDSPLKRLFSKDKDE